MPTSHTNPNTSTRSRSAGRASAAARAEIIEMLKQDHRRVKTAFRHFKKLDEHRDPQGCEALVRQTCFDLEVHTTLEEEFLYPAARACLGEEDLLDEAEVEHATVKSLINQIKTMAPGDEKYSAIFTVIGEYVNHHVKEEEREMFPKLSHAKFDWKQLHEQMNERRVALRLQSPETSRNGSDAAVEIGDEAASQENTAEGMSNSGGGKRRKAQSAKGKRKDEESMSPGPEQEENEAREI